MPSKVVNISLPAELLAEVDQAARQEKRTRSELFREAVRRYLAARDYPAPSWTGADRRALTTLADPALRRVWDNPQDAAYDDWTPVGEECNNFSEKPHGRPLS